MPRNYSLDFLRTLAILAVVVIHVSSAFLWELNTHTFSFYFISIVNQFSRFAVPVFFIVSGFLLTSIYVTKLNKSSLWEFYKKRILRILPPYLFWSAIYFVIFYHNSIQRLFSWEFLSQLLNGQASYQLYFIPAIIVLYALFPVFIRYKNIFLSGKFILGLFLFSCLLLYFVYYHQFVPPIFYPTRIALINTFPFLLGMFGAMHFEKIKSALHKNVLSILIVFFTTGIVVALEGISMTKHTGNIRFINDQWRPSVIIFGTFTAVFLDAFYNRFLQKRSKEVLFLSKYSFGVFFIHTAALTQVLKIVALFGAVNILTFTFATFATITISYTLVYIFSKIPKVGKILSAT